jgi:Na+/melibiose symporter-like transporter
VSSTAAPRPLTFRTKLFYGLGSISFGVHVQVFALLLFFYSAVVGVPAGLVSLALAATLVIDAVWDPIVGQLSDTLRTPWGRRHPLMYFSAVPVAVTMVLLWRPPASFSNPEKAVWLFAFSLLARLFISLYEVPSQALAPELAPDYHARTALLSYRWIFYVIGASGATMLGYFVFFRPTPHYPQGQLNPAAWGPLTLTAAAMAVASIVISTLGTHDRITSLHRPLRRALDLRRSFREIAAVVTNWNLCVAMGASLIAGLSAGFYLGLQLYIDTFFWGLKASGVGLLTLAALVAVIPGAWVANAFSRRFGKKYACITIFLVSTAVLQGPMLLRLLGLFPGPGDPLELPLLVSVRFLWGIVVNAGFIVVTSMVADITEDAQVKTGRRVEGLVMAANAFIVKATAGLSALAPGILLAYTHFPTKAMSVPAPVINHLVWVYLPVTTTISVLSILTWMLYRIDQATHERNLAAVGEAQAVAEAQLEAQGEGALTPLRAAG